MGLAVRWASAVGVETCCPFTTRQHNSLFCGAAQAWMDEVSFVAVTRFCRLPLVTLSSGRIDFNHAVATGGVVESLVRVFKVVNTSLKVEVLVENIYSDGREWASVA